MYGKIYEQTFTGSMYGSGSHIFAVWSYVIAHTKPDAMVELNPTELAHKLGEDVLRVEQAIEHFKSPDAKSRSKEFEGRRLIQKGEFIYFVPQYHKYHGFANNKERREYFAQKKREQRQRDKDCQTVKSKVSKNVQQSDTDTDSKTKAKTEKEIISFCVSLGLPESDGQSLWLKWQENGWRNGDRPIKDWRMTVRRWKLDNILPSQKQSRGSSVVRTMSAFEIEKRVAAITAEINATFKKNSGRVVGDGIDELKQRRDELQKSLLS